MLKNCNVGAVVIVVTNAIITIIANSVGLLPAGVKVQERSTHTTTIELIVDGDIIALNRINLSTLVVDERFKDDAFGFPGNSYGSVRRSRTGLTIAFQCSWTRRFDCKFELTNCDNIDTRNDIPNNAKPNLVFLASHSESCMVSRPNPPWRTKIKYDVPKMDEQINGPRNVATAKTEDTAQTQIKRINVPSRIV